MKDLDNLPPVLPLWPDAGQILGLGRSKTYQLAQRGEWPTKLLRIGRHWRVPTAELLQLIGADQQ